MYNVHVNCPDHLVLTPAQPKTQLATLFLFLQVDLCFSVFTCSIFTRSNKLTKKNHGLVILAVLLILYYWHSYLLLQNVLWYCKCKSDLLPQKLIPWLHLFHLDNDIFSFFLLWLSVYFPIHSELSLWHNSGTLINICFF